MEVRKRAIRIGALGAMLFTTSAMVFNGVAGAAPADEKPHKGHIHVDKKLKNGPGGKDDVKLDRQCAVAIRPHDYRGYDNLSFSLQAFGKKPTETKVPVKVGLGDATTTTANPSWDGVDPVVIHLDAIAGMVAPHGHYKVEKNGKVHNDLHWHVKLMVQDSLGQKWKKDVKVFNCDPKLPPAEPQCQVANGILGQSVGLDDKKFAQLGGYVGVRYLGSQEIAEEDVTFTIDGDEQDTYIVNSGGGTMIIVMVPALSSGEHTAKVDVDIDGDGDGDNACGAATFTFNTNQGNGGPT